MVKIMEKTDKKSDTPCDTGGLTKKRIGIAKDKLIFPREFDEDFDKMDKEIKELFEESDLM